jgi:RNA polymerase sigma-70 factor (sigma-E family)
LSANDVVEQEFREFVALRSAALLRSAYLLVGDWASAEDLLQTALTKTYLAWRRLGEIDAVEPYVRRVLINTATSWWRRRWHGERPTEVLPDRPARDWLDETLERDVLWRFVMQLPARQRAVLVLRFYEDLSEAETARLLSVSPGTIKSQTARALGTLRARLAQAGIEPTQMRPTAVAEPDKPASGRRDPALEPQLRFAGMVPEPTDPVPTDHELILHPPAGGPDDDKAETPTFAPMPIVAQWEG